MPKFQIFAADKNALAPGGGVQENLGSNIKRDYQGPWVTTKQLGHEAVTCLRYENQVR